MNKMKNILFLGIIFFFITSCSETYTPKPPAYFRISFPEKIYQFSDSTIPYSFEYPQYATIVNDTDKNAEPYWINVVFPQFNGKIHISYKEVDNNVFKFIDDAHTMAYKHSVKADAIGESVFENADNKVFGTLYSIEGNAASSIQFYLTDSVKHFVRGALYFNNIPNKDSIAPVVDFIEEDVIRLIDSFHWND